MFLLLSSGVCSFLGERWDLQLRKCNVSPYRWKFINTPLDFLLVNTFKYQVQRNTSMFYVCNYAKIAFPYKWIYMICKSLLFILTKVILTLCFEVFNQKNENSSPGNYSGIKLINLKQIKTQETAIFKQFMLYICRFWVNAKHTYSQASVQTFKQSIV